MDGWKDGTKHFHAIFAISTVLDTTKTILLTISPPFDETEYSAQSLASFILDTLDVFDRTQHSLLYFVADNTNVNPAIAEKLNIPFIGCYSLKFNLAVQKYLHENDFAEPLDNINALMICLRKVKKAGRLRRFTTLEPITRNVTR